MFEFQQSLCKYKWKRCSVVLAHLGLLRIYYSRTKYTNTQSARCDSVKESYDDEDACLCVYSLFDVLISVGNAFDCVCDGLLIILYMCWLLAIPHACINSLKHFVVLPSVFPRTHVHAVKCYGPFGKYLVVVRVSFVQYILKWNRNTIYIDNETWESKKSCEWPCRHSVSVCGMVNIMYTG